MTDHFLPGPASGVAARAAIQARLSESISHVLERSAGVVRFDRARADELVALLGSGRPVNPVVFSRYFRAVRSILAAEDDTDFADVEEKLAALLSAPFAAQGKPDVRPLSRTRFTPQEERELRDDFTSESLLDENIVTLQEEQANAALERCRTALALIREHAPRTAAELERTVVEIVPAGGRLASDGYAFDGCSSLERWGSVLVNFGIERSDVELCDVLVHEGAHNTLFGLSPVEFNLRNSTEERYPSPLRDDPRPLDGIYHATFVLARMHFAMSEFTASRTASPDLRAQAEERARSSAGLFWNGYAVLREHADYTRRGGEIMEAARDFMSRSAPRPAHV
jgi:HEXXH motif-containing protein